MKGYMVDEIRIDFFDGVYELIRVCSIHRIESDVTYFVYDIYPDDCMTCLYSGADRDKVLKLMQETYELTVEQEERI